jgi:DNA-binding MarR family transcriptional regulator
MSEFAMWYHEKSAEILSGIGARTNQKIQDLMEAVEDLQGLDISFIQVGYAFAPDPITPENYQTRGQYTNPTYYQEAMQGSVERGWLVPDDDQGYTLSDRGQEFARRFIASGNEMFSQLPGLSKEENKRGGDLLKKVVLEARELTDLDQKPSLEIGRRLEPKPDAAPMLRIRRYLTDIAYFREDVHIAAWKPYGVDGRVWETLTYLWREGPQTAAEIAEQISEYRNYEEEDYAAALDELAGRGWAAGEDGKFTLTEDGKQIREKAEAETDRLYAVAFEALTEADRKELKRFFEALAAVVVPPAEEEGEEG